jgi:hypothetical protein
MRTTLLVGLLLSLGAQGPEGAMGLRDRLLKLHLDDAAGYAIYLDADHKERAELRREPVYVWTNPVRTHKQDGAVFIWTYRGRPEAIGSIFSAPTKKFRGVSHEFHSLSLGPLGVKRDGPASEAWAPEVAGLSFSPIAGAPAPAESAVKRLAQMRSLAREFSASSHDARGGRWELRLLPQPLYRYESDGPEVTDGALFAYVTSAGTDPEVLLLIEARPPAGGGRPVWQAGFARFSDLDLSVRRKGAEVFAADLIRGNLKQMYPKQQYRVFRDRNVPLLEGEAP